MESENASALLAEGRRQYQRLLDEATDLLAKLDAFGSASMIETVQRRQEIVEQLQNFDGKFDGTAAGAEALAEFRAFREETTKRILELDGLVIALARDKQAGIKEKFASVTKSKSASRAYETGNASKSPSWVSETA
jgi:hypothetical protein